MGAGDAALYLRLQREEENPEHPLPELDGVLDNAVALVLAGGGGLLEGPASLKCDEPLAESDNRMLVVTLEATG